MASTRQRAGARKKAGKAQKARPAASSRTSSRTSARAAARAQPRGRKRAKPAAKGTGQFFHVEVRPRTDFQTFRTQDVGEKGGIERVAGKRASGSWSTVKWLIGKDHAHVEGRTLVADSADAKRLLARMRTAPVRIRGDRFEAKDRRNVPERDKPTPAQKRARSRNIKKAQAAKRKRAAA